MPIGQQDLVEHPGGPLQPGPLLAVGCKEDDEGPLQIHQGASGERICSVHDPGMRHGRKSAKVSFDGIKLALGVEVESQVIVAVDVMAGSANDDEGSPELAQQVEPIPAWSWRRRSAIAPTGRSQPRALRRSWNDAPGQDRRGQARYFGRTKTLFQALMVATEANLTLVAAQSLVGSEVPLSITALLTATGAFTAVALALLGSHRPHEGLPNADRLPPVATLKMAGCRPGF